MNRPLQHILANLTVILLVSGMMLTATVWWRQKVQFEEGEAGFRNGNFMVALTGYESAIRMYLPFTCRVEESAQQIWKLAVTAEQRGELNHALAAYRSLRSAFYAVRWLRQPGQPWIDRCDKKIAQLAAQRKGTGNE